MQKDDSFQVKSEEYTELEIEQLAEYSASLYAKTSKEKEEYLEYYRNYYKNGGSATNAPEKKNTEQPKSKTSDVVVVNGVEYKRYGELLCAFQR